MNDDFLRFLKPSAQKADRENFQKCIDKRITYGMCKRRVCKHNGIPESVMYATSVEEFKEWMVSLGWKEGEDDAPITEFDL